MTKLTHPEKALESTDSFQVVLPACEHIAGNQRFFEKALMLKKQLSVPFDITLDLEDGAPQGQETAQRVFICSALQQVPAGNGSLGVRIHPFTSEHFELDLQEVVAARASEIDYLTIPKVESAAQLTQIVTAINQHTSSSKTIPLHVLIETPQAVEEVWQIAQHPQVRVLDFGLMDFISSHHGAIPESCMVSPGQFQHHLVRRAKERICAAALAFHKTPSHNVSVNFRDTDQVFQDASLAYQQFGFLRMWSIYPTHVAAITRAMTPQTAVLELATQVLLLGQKSEWGPTSYEDRLHDRASYRYYWSILKRTKALGGIIPDAAQRAFF